MGEPFTEQQISQEELHGLTKPLLVLVQEPDPRLFSLVDSEALNIDIREELLPPLELTPQVLQKLSHLVYEPCLISDGPLSEDVVASMERKGVRLEIARFFGPYAVYGFEKNEEGSDRYLTFENKVDAVRGIASIAENTDLSYALSELDKKPKVPNQSDETVFKGLSESEREKIKTYYETALTEKFLTGLREAQSVADYPKTMLRGLVAVRNVVYAIEGDEANDPKKIFCQKYISPLIEYLEYRLATADRSELAVESLINYDFVLNIMHFQSDILVGP